MNRREFCFSLGALTLGSTMSGWGSRLAGANAVGAGANEDFRAKMIFPEYWQDRFGFQTIPQRIKQFRNELIALAKEYDALVLNNRQTVPSGFFAVLEAEASRLGLELYFPASFPVEGVDFSRMHVRPLTAEERVLREVETANDSQGGLHFSQVMPGNSPPLRGIILYDTSRCRWRTFLCRTSGTSGKMPPETFIQTRNLKTAQWLDAVQKQFAEIQQLTLDG